MFFLSVELLDFGKFRIVLTNFELNHILIHDPAVLVLNKKLIKIKVSNVGILCIDLRALKVVLFSCCRRKQKGELEVAHWFILLIILPLSLHYRAIP